MRFVRPLADSRQPMADISFLREDEDAKSANGHRLTAYGQTN